MGIFDKISDEQKQAKEDEKNKIKKELEIFKDLSVRKIFK